MAAVTRVKISGAMRSAIPPLSGRAVVQAKSAEAACSDSILPRRAAAGGAASKRKKCLHEMVLFLCFGEQTGGGGAASLKSQPLFEGNFGLRNASCHCNL